MNKITFFTALAATAALTACSPEPRQPTADELQNRKQEEMSKQGVESVGLPAIKNFQEKRLMKDILEMRDNPNLRTYTYTQDMNGRFHKICDSIGYGLPYATQYTSPQKESDHSYQLALPQADPNGLYSPPSADGTWVLCKVPGKDKLEPQYIEPHVIVTTFPLSN